MKPSQLVSLRNSRAKGSRWGSAVSWSRTHLKCAWASARRLRRVWSTLMRISRVFAPASDWDPKLTLRAMTVGRSSRSQRLLSGGTRRSVTQR